MTYTTPPKFRSQLRKGEVVVVRDRDLNPIGTAVVRRAGTKIVSTVDGRRWRASDGWYVGEHSAYPFPSIARKAAKASKPKGAQL